MDYTFANCVDTTSNRLFYALTAAENLVVFGSDVSNAFGEAPGPKQQFFIRPDRAFREWWTSKGHDPIPYGHMVPVLKALQGHPESGRLWGKYANVMLMDMGFIPTTHEPCLYSALLEIPAPPKDPDAPRCDFPLVKRDPSVKPQHPLHRVLFKRQVDDFEVAAEDERIANIVFDALDAQLTFPLKRMGRVKYFNGLDILQTRDYVKISCQTYISKIMEWHMSTWLNPRDISYMGTRPTPLPATPLFMKKFLEAEGVNDEKEQAKLAKQKGFPYRKGIGELIWPCTTCRPDIGYATVRCSQYSGCPADVHYDGVRHCLKYLFTTKDEGIYFWRTSARTDLPPGPLPNVQSNLHDLMWDGRPEHDSLELHAYMDSDWAGCPRTRRSFGGRVVRIAGGPALWKAGLSTIVCDSSTMAEFIEACNTGKSILFLRSVMYDLGIPQGAATIAYEDNDAATSMANAQKPTKRTRHLDIKYFELCEWVERDLIKLERIDTSLNMSDHFSKQLGVLLFYRHNDYIMGRVPPKYSHCFQQMYDTLKARKRMPMSSPITDPLLKDHPAAAAAARLVASWMHIIDMSL